MELPHDIAKVGQIYRKDQAGNILYGCFLSFLQYVEINSRYYLSDRSDSAKLLWNNYFYYILTKTAK